jgi:hypothetical protein
VLKADTDNPHGQRRLTSENVALLKGFNWTERVKVSNVLRCVYSITLDEEQGTARLEIPSLVPKGKIKAGSGATHVQVCLVLAGVDFNHDKQTNACAVSGMIDLSLGEAISKSLSCSLDADGFLLVVAGVGVQGYQKSNEGMVAMQDKYVF